MPLDIKILQYHAFKQPSNIDRNIYKNKEKEKKMHNLKVLYNDKYKPLDKSEDKVKGANKITIRIRWDGIRRD